MADILRRHDEIDIVDDVRRLRQILRAALSEAGDANDDPTARAAESAMIARCAAVARDAGSAAQDWREANVFRVAAMVVRSRFPRESEQLMHVADAYFGAHPDEKLAPTDVIRQGWIVSLPRLCERLSRALGWPH
jgi:hypothetical protein